MIGRTGRHHLATGAIEGTDPLGPFGDHAPAMLRAATSMPQAPEIYVNSAVDPAPSKSPRSSRSSAVTAASEAGRTAASSWPPPTCSRPTWPIVGGDVLHQHLVHVLEQLGHRTTLQRSTP